MEREVVRGKGQFICGNKKCELTEQLRSWEVNFAYIEHEEKKNALIKLSKFHSRNNLIAKIITDYCFIKN